MVMQQHGAGQGGLSVTVRALEAADHEGWLPLWRAYCAFYKVTVPDTVTHTLWSRILDPQSSVKGLVALSGARPVGLCHYVLHPHTWSDRTLCYLEDLFTDATCRGQGVGHALIGHLRDLAQAQGWRRVYWHTETDNHTARRLYDHVAGGADPFVRYTLDLA